MADTRAVPRPFAFFAFSLLSIAVAAFYVSTLTFGISIGFYLLLIVAVAVISENTTPVIGGHSVSLALPLTMTAMLLQGPTAAAFVAGFCALKPETFQTRRGLTITMYNMAQFVLAALATGWIYLAAGGRTLTLAGTVTPLTESDFPFLLFPLAIAALTCALGNLLLVSAGVAVLNGLKFKDTLVSAASYTPSLIALSTVGYLIAQVMASNAASLLLFVFPLAVAQSLYQRFKSLKDAYADTVRSFVGALEAKDPYTRGHSERVSRYALQIGDALGLDARTRERLEYSSLLHDLGKISLSQVLLTKPGSLTDEEMGVMRRHPAEGAAMVERVPPLSGLAEYVRQHHEQYGGGGYPLGNSGSRIPLLSRILSVADAFDAMTTNRSYRSALPLQEALDRLVEASGTQFDPEIVDAFLRSGPELTQVDPPCRSDETPAAEPVLWAGGEKVVS